MNSGWLLEKRTYQNEDRYSLVAPSHFTYSLNTWGCKIKTEVIDGITISFPDYYYDDNVLVSGDR